MRAKYYIGKLPLRRWCDYKNYPYQIAVRYVRSNPNFTVDELENLLKSKVKDGNEQKVSDEIIEEEVSGFIDSKTKYTYQGMSLKKYCEMNNINYQKIYTRLKRLKDKSLVNKMISDYMNEANNTNDKKRKNHNIDGMTLREYCIVHGIVYPTIKTYLQNILKENPNLEDDEALRRALDYYNKKHVFKEKFFYHGEKLSDFCRRNNYTYNTIWMYLKIYVKNSFDITDEEIEKAIKKYKIKMRKDSFKEIDKKETLSDCIDILKYLNVDIDSVNLVMSFGFDFKKAIYFVWYFGIEENNVISITKERIREVYSNLGNLEKLEINELLGYYKSGLYDTRTIMYNNCLFAIRKIAISLTKKYYGFIDYEDIKAHADSLFMIFIEHTSSRYLGQIICYMNSFISGALTEYIVNEKKEIGDFSLNDKIGDSEKEIINFYSDMYDFESEIINSDLSFFLDKLSVLECQFIILKYEKMYSDYEISKILYIDDVDSFNKAILDKLRENEDIKKLFLTKFMK